jgi:hypothetical protein
VVALGVSRDGQPMTVKVQLGDKHKEYPDMNQSSKGFYFDMPKITVPEIDIPSITVMTISSERSGLTVENITPQLGDFLGVKNGNGVLVRSVDKGSRADRAGFRAGDVIVKINAESVHDTSDFSRAVRSRNGNSVNVGVIREKKEQNLNLALPEKKQSGEWFDEESLNLRQEIATASPQMELALADGQRRAADTPCRLVREQQRQLRQQADRLRVKLQVQQRQLQRTPERLKKQTDELKNRRERMRQEMQGHWLDI